MLRVLNELRCLWLVCHGGLWRRGWYGLRLRHRAYLEDHTNFGLTETRLGLIGYSPYVIARMGEGKARRVFMSARIFRPRGSWPEPPCKLICQKMTLRPVSKPR